MMLRSRKRFGFDTSSLSYLFLVGIFLYALIFPEKNTDLILVNWLYIFIAEIISINIALTLPDRSPEWSWSLRYDWRTVLTPLMFIILPTIFFISFFNMWLPGLVFLFSSIAKVFNRNSYIINKSKLFNYYMYSMGLFFVTLIIAVILAPTIAAFIEFPKILLPSIPTEAIFNNYPQAILFWGILYFSIQFLLQSIYIKSDNEHK